MELLLVNNTRPADTDEDRWNWDIDVKDGIAVSVPENAEEDQAASVVAYLEKDTIPLLPDKGVDWPKYLNKQVSLAEIDTQIRENLKTYLDTLLYSPVYMADQGKLVLRMTKIIINTGA